MIRSGGHGFWLPYYGAAGIMARIRCLLAPPHPPTQHPPTREGEPSCALTPTVGREGDARAQRWHIYHASTASPFRWLNTATAPRATPLAAARMLRPFGLSGDGGIVPSPPVPPLSRPSSPALPANPAAPNCEPPDSSSPADATAAIGYVVSDLLNTLCCCVVSAVAAGCSCAQQQPWNSAPLPPLTPRAGVAGVACVRACVRVCGAVCAVLF